METPIEQLITSNIKKMPPSFVKGMLGAASRSDLVSLSVGNPSPKAFPMEELHESMSRAVERYGTKLFQYSQTPGIAELREFVADRYNKKLNLGITAADVLITTGSQQALDIIAKLVLEPGDGVVVEEPGYLGALRTFLQYAPTFHSVPLREGGLDVARFGEAVSAPKTKLVYTVPNFQNPSGLTYSAENREALYNVLKNENVIYIEDDPYGELRFKGENLPYVAVGRYENYIFLGSFSKTVTPGARVGFVICKNKELMEAITNLKESTDVHTSTIAQYVLYDYVTHNDYEAHIEDIRKLYKEQCELMLSCIAENFPDYVEYTKPEGGMFIWCTLPEGQRSIELWKKALENGVAVAPGEPFYVDPQNVRTFRMNYTQPTPEQIRLGIERLGKLL